MQGMYTSSMPQHTTYWGESAPETRPWAGWLWQRVRYATLGGKQQWLFGGHVGRQCPAVGDLDGDGDLDCKKEVAMALQRSCFVTTLGCVGEHILRLGWHDETGLLWAPKKLECIDAPSPFFYPL